MPAGDAVPFAAPAALAAELDLPNAGRVRGLGVRAGVTLVVGGGFHGKSTLLEALQAGVYNKARRRPPGRGRGCAWRAARRCRRPCAARRDGRPRGRGPGRARRAARRTFPCVRCRAPHGRGGSATCVGRHKVQGTQQGLLCLTCER
jgi:hypothetical protein